MKKLSCVSLIFCLLISLTGCGLLGMKPPISSGNGSSGTDETASGFNNENPQAAMIAVSVPTTTENTTGQDGTVLFQYTYQHMTMVLQNQVVADKIIVDFLNRVDKTRKSAEDISEMAKSAYNGSPNWNPYLYHLTYSPTRIDSKVLSLFGNNVTYVGGGHPERTCVSVSYDLDTGDVLTLASIKTVEATANSFCNLVLEGLADMAEGDYLYENYAQTVKQRFNADPTQDEAWYFTQTGLCFYFVPYEIAPYSSGVVTVEIPFEKLKGILHASYLPSAEGSAQGAVTLTPFENVNLEDFAHIAEIVASNDGKMYMARTNGSVQDIRILLSDGVSSYTVFAANGLSAGDGIMVQANDKQLQSMKLTYKTDTATNTIPLTN